MSEGRFTRRQLLSTAATGLAAVVGGRSFDLAAQSPPCCVAGASNGARAGERPLRGRPRHGRRHDHDPKRSHRERRHEGPARAGRPTIDLGGRTVVPGLFDAHVHYTRAAVNPGYEARRIERAFSIVELQETIAERAKSVPPASSSPASVAGTTRSSPRRGGRQRRNSTPRRQTWGLHLGDRRRNGRDHQQPRSRVLCREASWSTTRRACWAAAPPSPLFRRCRRTKTSCAAPRPERACQQPGADWRDKRRKPRRPGVRASALARGQTLHPHAAALSRGFSRASRDTLVNNFSQSGRAVGDDLFRVAGFGERIGGTETMSPQLEPTARVIARYGWLLQQHSIR